VSSKTLSAALLVSLIACCKGDGDRIAPFVAAAERLSFRPTEARLSGFRSYRPHRPATRSGTMTALNVAPVTRGDLHALGIAFLMKGNAGAAVANFERALFASTRTSAADAALAVANDPVLLNDAAAAYLTRRALGEIPDVLLAAEAAERAWRMHPTPEVAWNRALAREALHVPAQALTAWNDFLQLDPDSEWATEAHARIRRLSEVTQSRRWIAERRALLERDEIPRALPQEVRGFAEEQLLLSWAGAVLRNDPVSAEHSLALAGSIGETLAAASGERLLAGSVAAIKDADPVRRGSLAEAHMRYANGKRLLGAQRMRDAVKELEAASRTFEANGSPFVFRSQLFQYTAEYYATDLDGAEKHLRGLLQRQDDLTVSGQAEWVIGLIEFARGHNNEALTAFRKALASFERAGELENAAGIETLLGETYLAIGQNSDSWLHQERALRSMERLGATRRSHAILSSAAEAASRWNLPLAALVFQSDLVSIARVSNDQVSICDALIARASYAAAAGEKTTALADIAEVARRAPAIEDVPMRNRTRANFLAAEVKVWGNFDRRRASQSANQAIAEMERVGQRTRLVQLQLDAGRASIALGDAPGALGHWKDGIDECEQQRAMLSDREYRRTFFDQCRALFDESIGVLAGGNRFAEARVLADRQRARVLRETISDSPETPLPTDVTVVELAVLPDRIIVWTTTATGGTTGMTSAISRTALRNAVDDLGRDDVVAFRKASAKLYDLLLRPVESRLDARVVIIPDLDTYRIPFAALFDVRRGRFFIEDHEVLIVPSASLLTRRPAMKWSGARRALLVDASAGELEGAAREVSDIAALYPEAKVMRGSAYTSGDFMRSLQSAELAHIAGHALRNSDLADPALVLRSGLIYPSEIASLPLANTRLVVLAACGTGSGRIGSEGPLSIARAFLAAGSERVVATLWDVDDEATSRLMTRFHHLLRNDTDPLRALQSLQREAIRNSVPARDWGALEILQTQL
jgi:CHAT domain-containing protein